MLDRSADAILALYEAHGTHEPFHRAFKTGLDLQRRPSGTFDTGASPPWPTTSCA